jgi:hypothetical protein
VKREQAVAEIRTIQRTCRGLPVLSSEQMSAFQKQWQEAVTTGDFEIVQSTVTEFEKAVGFQVAPFEEGNLEAAGGRAARAIYAHGDNIGKPCGYNVNDIIESFPFDGKPHDYVCPQCGQKGYLISPVFEIDEEPVQE